MSDSEEDLAMNGYAQALSDMAEMTRMAMAQAMALADSMVANMGYSREEAMTVARRLFLTFIDTAAQ